MSERASYLPYLKTLRRIPAPIVQAMATHEVIPNDGHSCLCGWAVREALAFANGHTSVESVPSPSGSHWDCLNYFGGTLEEWCNIYGGITRSDKFPDIEEAFARRVAECVR